MKNKVHLSADQLIVAVHSWVWFGFRFSMWEGGGFEVVGLGLGSRFRRFILPLKGQSEAVVLTLILHREVSGSTCILLLICNVEVMRGLRGSIVRRLKRRVR
jgi:hypothetical protein